MGDSSLFPDWLPDRAVDDDLFAQAYESCSVAQRGWLKKCVSLHFALYGESPAREVRHVAYPRLGVSASCMQRPVAWTLLLLDDVCLSPVRALAAVLPALLAGVPEVLVARLRSASSDEPEWPAGVLVGLELAGVRRMVDLTLEEAKELLERLRCGGRPGRVLALGDGFATEKASRLFSECHAPDGIVCWKKARPGIGVWRNPAEELAESGMTLADVLAWAHPDVTPEFHEESTFDAAGATGCGALLVAEQQLEAARNAAGLVLGPGVEGCWFWPDLSPDFFLRRTLCCSSPALPECE